MNAGRRYGGRALLGAAALAALAACSDINGSDGIIALALALPTDRSLEVGETAQLEAWGLTAEGDSVGIDVDWLAADTTVTVDATGLVTARFPGPGRVQAQSGTLVSDLVAFTITATPDTLIVPDPPTLTVAPGVATSGPLLARLETVNPSVPVPGAQITFRIAEPEFATPEERTVELTGGVLQTTATTGPAGTPLSPVQVQRVLGTTQPDSAIVEVTAANDGVPVPGSGQIFIVYFQQ